MDIFTVIDRSFRLEFPPDSPYCTVHSPSPQKPLPPRKDGTPNAPVRTPLKDLTPKV